MKMTARYFGAQVVLLLFLFLCLSETSDDFIALCHSQKYNESDAELAISPTSKYLTTVPDFGSDGFSTAFVEHNENYTFRCSGFSDQENVKISYMQSDDNPKIINSSEAEGVVESALSYNDIKQSTAINSYNLTVTCTSGGELVCAVKFITIWQKKNPRCEQNGTISCNAADFADPSSRSSSFFGPRILKGSTRYSFYEQINMTWVYCDSMDESGQEMSPGTSYGTAASIRCPIPEVEKPMPIIIRVEKVKNSGLGVGLPVFGGSAATNRSFSYYTVMVNTTTPIPKVTAEVTDDVTQLLVGILVSMAVLLILLIVFVLIFVKRRQKKKLEKEANRYNAMKMTTNPNGTADVSHPARDDVESTLTDSTGVASTARSQQYMADILSLLNLSDDKIMGGDSNEMDRGQFKQLLQRQLSGDPTKINPNLSLNQQVNILSYDPKLEIDRSKFSIGSLLGSGHFGSVYDGEAEGLLHPGSRTRVAVKTVNDVLDLAQFTALMCEMKIMTNLDLHLNLVNLLGSCTSQLESRNLWLLLEYCPHGNLKDYLIQHRAEFRNGLSGLVTPDPEYDARVFLKWAHSIAKGMHYLSSKRIMHGDLAARNILLGNNLVAKISDFGLSKSMYDNIRYKKQKRHYVPWKWMALEYLTDAHFTLKSDVWSYGIVLWEMFSLGQEPYGSKDVEEVVKEIKAGERLELPEEVRSVDWAETIFETVMRPSWRAEPDQRVSFEEIVKLLVTLMELDERHEYHRLTEEYEEMEKLLLNAEFASKRNTMVGNELTPGYQRLFSLDAAAAASSASASAAADGYQSLQDAVKANMAPSSPKQEGYVAMNLVQSSDYVTLDQAQSEAHQTQVPDGYTTLAQAKEEFIQASA